jgi:hypothetical protein
MRIPTPGIRFVATAAIGALLVATVPLSRAQVPPVSAGDDILSEMKIIEKVTASIDRGLDHLARQQRQDGAWTGNNAVNALALLAFMGRGHTPGRGPYRDVLERGKRVLLASAQPTGSLAGPSGNMYEHGLATLALAEMYGMDPDPEVETKLRKAVDLIVQCQSPAGGWRYQPRPEDQDLSVTVMQVVALRAANNAEIPVPATTIERAIAYVRSCGTGDGFAYQAGGGTGAPTTAAGILSLQLLGQFADKQLPKALDNIQNNVPVQWGGLTYWFYFHYYAIQAEYQAGGKYWNQWHPRVRELLLSKQNPDGSWDCPPGSNENDGIVGPNKIYTTAMSSLILEIYNHFLPAYQR